MMDEQQRMSFHFPEGLAAVIDSSGAYHIHEDEKEAYSHRFIKTFGFYNAVATVVDELGYFHIDVLGGTIHSHKFKWSGNFQGNVCVVEDGTGFYHIDKTGEPVYISRFSYVGDYRYERAVAYQGEKAFHINHVGQRIYNHSFEYAEPFHKGFAVVRDEHGFFHIDVKGNAIYQHRFKRAEPFYNNYAFCETLDGQLVRLHENGHYTLILQKYPPVNIATINDMIGDNDQVVMLVRHAERQAIHAETPNWGHDVTLTKQGKECAAEFGSFFNATEKPKVITSPVPRCIETGRDILSSYHSQPPTELNPLLGDPGVYFDGSSEHESEMSADFYAFIEHYVTTGFASGMRPIADASNELIHFVKSQLSKESISVLVSHDLHIVCLMSFLGLKVPNRNDWCDYLAGICFVKSGNDLSVRLISEYRG